MAKIENSSPKQSGGGYLRLVGDAEMAEIFTKAQSTVISNGTELEKIITELSNDINDLDVFIAECESEKGKEAGHYLCTKKVLKKSRFYQPEHEPDFIAFVVNGNKNRCYVVELKDGDAFDTKKSSAEREMLSDFVYKFAAQIPFVTNFYICCFNQEDKEKIVAGFKKRFSLNEVMTGRELCEVLNIDYDGIIKRREKDVADNFKYVVDSVNKIFRKRISENDFYADDGIEADE